MARRNVIIFLHGSGGDGRELRAFLEAYRLPAFNMQTFRQVLDSWNTDLITPTSSLRPYTPAGGETMNVWFDRTANFQVEGLRSKEDTEGANRSLDSLISSLNLSSYNHVIFGGFSMGGGLCLHSYRTLISPKLRGVFTMGSFLVESSAVLTSSLIEDYSKIPLLMMHGEDDSLIRINWGKATATSLHMRGLNVDFRRYPHTDHELGEEEMLDLLHWIKHILDNAEERYGASTRAEGKDDDRVESSRSNDRKRSAKDSDEHNNVVEDEEIDGIVKEMSIAQKEDSKGGGRETLEDCFPYSITYMKTSNSGGGKVVITYEVPQEW
jgi:predicted esterase